MSNIIETSVSGDSLIRTQTSIVRKLLGIRITEITNESDNLTIIPSERDACRIVEFFPNTKKILMHATPTTDYGIILEGEIYLKLKNNTLHLKKGDCFIQNSAEHAWINTSDELCKIFFVLVKNG